MSDQPPQRPPHLRLLAPKPSTDEQREQRELIDPRAISSNEAPGVCPQPDAEIPAKPLKIILRVKPQDQNTSQNVPIPHADTDVDVVSSAIPSLSSLPSFTQAPATTPLTIPSLPTRKYNRKKTPNKKKKTSGRKRRPIVLMPDGTPRKRGRPPKKAISYTYVNDDGDSEVDIIDNHDNRASEWEVDEDHATEANAQNITDGQEPMPSMSEFHALSALGFPVRIPQGEQGNAANLPHKIESARSERNKDDGNDNDNDDEEEEEEEEVEQSSSMQPNCACCGAPKPLDQPQSSSASTNVNIANEASSAEHALQSVGNPDHNIINVDEATGQPPALLHGRHIPNFILPPDVQALVNEQALEVLHNLPSSMRPNTVEWWYDLHIGGMGLRSQDLDFKQFCLNLINTRQQNHIDERTLRAVLMPRWVRGPVDNATNSGEKVDPLTCQIDGVDIWEVILHDVVKKGKYLRRYRKQKAKKRAEFGAVVVDCVHWLRETEGDFVEETGRGAWVLRAPGLDGAVRRILRLGYKRAGVPEGVPASDE